MAWRSPCEDFPRILPSVLAPEDVDYLKYLFKEIVEKEWEADEAKALAEGRPRPRRMLEYYTLLRYLNGRERDGRLEDILAKIGKIIEKQFGSGYVIFNDFWSWRSSTNVAAERVHMDSDFWVTKQHDGFNLWMLLDHKDMPYSFDIFVKEENPDLYPLVKLPRQSTWLIPEQDPQKKKGCAGILFWEPLGLWPVLYEWKSTRVLAMAFGVLCMKWWMTSQAWMLRVKKVLPSWLFRGLLFFTGWTMRLTALPGGLELKTKRFDLTVGDALVVRQHELHGTDKDPLKPGQCRLALGLKIMRQAPVVQYAYTGPAPKSRRQYPGLRLPLFQPLQDVYKQKGLDMTPFQYSGLAGWFAQVSKARFTKAT